MENIDFYDVKCLVFKNILVLKGLDTNILGVYSNKFLLTEIKVN